MKSRTIEPTTIDKFLNNVLSKNELEKNIKKLKNGKAPGQDRISNEMIKASYPVIHKAYLKLFNLIFSSQHVPENWCKSIITPIHKSGNKMDPDNYRPICVTSCIAKLFCTLLNDRLTSLFKAHDIINPAQIGFINKHRTSDNLFTLKTLINKHVYNNTKEKIYACFVDFRKAFDSVWHEGLFHKLESLNIHGNFLSIVKNIYSETVCAVKIGNQLTNFFQYSKGVRQGCPLSPTLFNFFINDLINQVESVNPAPLSLQDNVSCLLYADDLILLSKTANGLQTMLNELSNFCKSWRINVNTKKTKCITFQKKSRVNKKDSFFFDNKLLENVNEYKYLGITINSAGSFNPTFDILSNKANRAIYALNSKYATKRLPVWAASKLFDSVISPILLYGSEIWGAFGYLDYEKWDSNPIEKVHLSFCKHVLGVNRSTTNNLVRGELGRYPLKTTIDCRYISFLQHIKNMPQSSLVYQALIANKELDSNINFTTHLNNIGASTKSPNILNMTKNQVKNTMKLSYNKVWKSRIQETSKGKFFTNIKKNIFFEQYLTSALTRSERILITKLRTSDHDLEIKKGRRHKPVIPRENRFCKFCNNNQIEDEIHFIFECTTYEAQKSNFLRKCHNLFPRTKHLGYQDLLQFIFMNPSPQLLSDLISYIHDISNTRSQLSLTPAPLGQ